jgi:predicted enzyme related to lactoylglutathione lyase
MEKARILGLRTVIYKVSDINAAKAWYARAFNAKPYFDQPFYVGFNIGGYELGLDTEESSPKHKAESVLTYWGVDDIELAYKNFHSNGAANHEEPRTVGEGIMVASVKDPWGNIIGLIYNPHFRQEK